VCGVDGGYAGQPKRELLAAGTTWINGDVEAGALGVLHIGAWQPVQTGCRGLRQGALKLGEREHATEKHRSDDERPASHQASMFAMPASTSRPASVRSPASRV
jgi:hypothetical protein